MKFEKRRILLGICKNSVDNVRNRNNLYIKMFTGSIMFVLTVFKSVSRQLNGCFRDNELDFQGLFEGVSGVFHGCFECGYRVFQRHFEGVFHCYHIIFSGTF